MEQLNCAEENGIIKFGPQVLMRELSQNLAAFCDVLAHPSSGTNSPRQLSQDLQDSLEINGDALWEKDRRHKDEKRDKRLSALEQGWDAKKPRHDEVGGAEVSGGFGGGSRWGAQYSGRTGRVTGGVATGGKSYCIAQVCHEYLGSRCFDGKEPLTACRFEHRGCKFEHSVPKVPVSAAEKRDLERLVTHLSGMPEKKAALEIVMGRPTFGG